MNWQVRYGNSGRFDSYGSGAPQTIQKNTKHSKKHKNPQNPSKTQSKFDSGVSLEFSVFFEIKACSKSHPSCNMVNCLQLVAHYYSAGKIGASNHVKLCVFLSHVFLIFSRFVNSFGLGLGVARDMIIPDQWKLARPPGKSIRKILRCDTVILHIIKGRTSGFGDVSGPRGAVALCVGQAPGPERRRPLRN